MSETAPDLTGDNLYFDHAEVNGKRVYEAGTLTEQDITYYGSISGALSILGESETIDLYYVSKYPVTYHVTGAEKTAAAPQAPNICCSWSFHLRFSIKK